MSENHIPLGDTNTNMYVYFEGLFLFKKSYLVTAQIKHKQKSLYWVVLRSTNNMCVFRCNTTWLWILYGGINNQSYKLIFGQNSPTSSVKSRLKLHCSADIYMYLSKFIKFKFISTNLYCIQAKTPF